ncbi:MAG: peptidase [Pseudomonadota bacterium]|nr:peptidase [Pseudomonadota bacterium]
MFQDFLRPAAAGLAATLILAPAVSAQDYSLQPSFGSINLSSGFLPDPYERRLTAGGTIRAQNRFSNCRGYIANAPDFSLYYTAGSQDLFINVDSEADTTLVVNGPDGRWYCDDDGADAAFNPLLHWQTPQSGRYDIWVGTYSTGSGVPATLFISELGEATVRGGLNMQSASSVDISAPARYNVTLNGGFLPDPEQIHLQAGGNIRAADAISSQCRGYVDYAPTVQLTYNGSGTLHIYTHGNADTTLAINAPDGQWFCNDDAIGTDAGISFTAGTRGVYDIYVGTYSSGRADTTLRISEIRLGYTPGGK